MDGWTMCYWAWKKIRASLLSGILELRGVKVLAKMEELPSEASEVSPRHPWTLTEVQGHLFRRCHFLLPTPLLTI